MPATLKPRAKKKRPAPKRRRTPRKAAFVPPTLSPAEIAEENAVVSAAARDISPE